jgi:hypothetical protein
MGRKRQVSDNVVRKTLKKEGFSCERRRIQLSRR